MAQIRIGHEGWVLCSGEDCRDCVPVRFLERHSAALQWLNQARGDSMVIAALRRLLVEVGSQPGGHLTDNDVLVQIAWAIEFGRLHVCRHTGAGAPAADAGGAGAAAPPPSQPEEDQAAAPVPKPKKTWVEFKVVDMEGNPATGAHYLVMLPDGSLHEGNLDRSGVVRFDPIDPENSVFSLPDLDRDAWEKIG